MKKLTNIQKTAKVLDFLDFGMEITIDDRKLCFGEDEKGRVRLSTILEWCQTGSEPEDKLLAFDISLDAFILMMEKVSDDDIILWGGSKALTEINRKKRS